MDFTFMSNEDFLPKEEAIKIKDKAITWMTPYPYRVTYD